MNRTEFIGTYLYYSQDFVDDLYKEIERLKTDYQQANDIIVEQSKEIERLNNIINEIKKGLDKFYKEHSRLMWTEEDYIEFINCIDRELKRDDKE